MENKVFCKTRISKPRKICYIVSVLLAIVTFIAMIANVIPVEAREDHYYDCIDYYNIYGE